VSLNNAMMIVLAFPMGRRFDDDEEAAAVHLFFPDIDALNLDSLFEEKKLFWLVDTGRIMFFNVSKEHDDRLASIFSCTHQGCPCRRRIHRRDHSNSWC
jgi:hypothetical protein